MDTATLAFGQAQPWEALASPVGSPETTTAERLQANAAGQPVVLGRLVVG
jgi:hypothetical protein